MNKTTDVVQSAYIEAMNRSFTLHELNRGGVVLEGKRLSVTTIKGQTFEGTCGQVRGSWCVLVVKEGVSEPVVAENVRLTRVDFIAPLAPKRKRNGH